MTTFTTEDRINAVEEYWKQYEKMVNDATIAIKERNCKQLELDLDYSKCENRNGH
jgi:hypothetical protein